MIEKNRADHADFLQWIFLKLLRKNEIFILIF